jgi:hypothetical protein
MTWCGGWSGPGRERPFSSRDRTFDDRSVLFAEERIEQNKNPARSRCQRLNAITHAVIFVGLTLCGKEQDDEE